MTTDKEIEVGKHGVKINYAILASAIIFLIMSAYFFGIKTAELNSRIEANTHNLEKINTEMTYLKNQQEVIIKENVAVKVQLATIEVKLTNIEQLLLEWKNENK